VVKGRRRAVDSTILADAVATQDTITQLIAASAGWPGWCRGRRGRSRRCAPKALLRTARASWAAQPTLCEDYRKYRPSIERVISEVASRGGRRLKLRYLGTARNNAWLKNRTARPQPAHPHHPRPGPRERNMGTRLSDHRPAGRLRPPAEPASLAAGGKSDHVAHPQGPGLLPHRRPCRRSSRPRNPVIQSPPSGR